MFKLIFSKDYEEELGKLEPSTQKQIDKKVQQLEFRPLLGKRLVGHPYWSIHIGDFRIIYKIDNHDQTIEILTILKRKHNYREFK